MTFSYCKKNRQAQARALLHEEMADFARRYGDTESDLYGERFAMSRKPSDNGLPRASGVYQIRCRANGKIYIGSSVDMYKRWLTHRSGLRRREHPNIYLQEAWNQYGEAQFEISVLNLVDEDRLLQMEQAWIDYTNCTHRSYGFNIATTAGPAGDWLAQTWEGFFDPDGNELVIHNLHGFCRKHGLDFPSMLRLSQGKSKLKSYKGWTHRNSVRQRPYVKTYEGFIDPTGKEVGPITNLAAFCREHGLDNTHLLAVMRGRICSHCRWTHINSRTRSDIHTYSGFINPAGQRVIITNLQAFCRANGLSVVHMHQIKSGKRPSHKGWTWKQESHE